MCTCYCRNGPCCRCPVASTYSDSACGASACGLYALCACSSSTRAAVSISGCWCVHVLSSMSFNLRSSAWLSTSVLRCPRCSPTSIHWRHYLVVVSVLLLRCLKKKLMRLIASRSYRDNKTRKLCAWEVVWLNVNSFWSGVPYYSGCYQFSAQYYSGCYGFYGAQYYSGCYRFGEP